MTKQQFLELYGQSVYQVRLQLGCALAGSLPVEKALKVADNFVVKLLNENPEQLREGLVSDQEELDL